MLNNFWYAVEFSDEITSIPKRIKVLDQDLAIYRTDSQKIVAMQDLCAHRGAALSEGFQCKFPLEPFKHYFSIQLPSSSMENLLDEKDL